MTTYICKCGRLVAKSTNADNTGNRDTAGCEGCPYLLPWGPYQYVEGQGVSKDVQGYECRMSKDLDYATRFGGSITDKCTCYIASLDFDFLTRVSDWIKETYPGKELVGSFSVSSIRAVEYSSNGRYRMGISCVQNKKGIAAKAALLHQFFDDSGARLDMTPEEEKAHILAAIEAGKARAQKGEDKKVEYIISRNTENGLTYAYYRGAFWFWDERAGRWFLSPHAKELYAGFSAGQPGSKPEDMLCSGNFEALDDWDIPAKVIDDLLSRNPKKEKRENPTDAAEDAQPCAPTASDVPPSQSQSVDADAQPDASDDLPEICRGCQCAICGNENCASPCWENPKEVDDCKITGPAGDNCKDYRPKEDTRCQKAPAQKMAAAATTETSVATTECPDISTLTNVKKSAAPASPADAGAATQSLSAADPASLAAESAQLAFDYSGLDPKTVDTLHVAEQMIFKARRDAHIQIAQAVSFAHDALCGGVVQNLDNSKHGNRGDESFGCWCKSVGISRSAAYSYLNVASMFFNSTPEEQAALLNTGKSLLAEAAKPSAPAELVQAVKDGDITTHKQYQEAMAAIKERDAKIQELLEMSEAADRRADEAQAWAKKAESDAREAQKERDGARDALQAAKRRGDQWQEKAEARQARIQELENRPIQATAVDSDEVDRMVTQRLEEELAKQMPRQQEEQEQAARDAYDAFILTARSLDNLWRTLKPQIVRLAPDQKNGAKNLLLQKLMEVKEELIHACEDHQP